MMVLISRVASVAQEPVLCLDQAQASAQGLRRVRVAHVSLRVAYLRDETWMAFRTQMGFQIFYRSRRKTQVHRAMI